MNNELIMYTHMYSSTNMNTSSIFRCIFEYYNNKNKSINYKDRVSFLEKIAYLIYFMITWYIYEDISVFITVILYFEY